MTLMKFKDGMFSQTILIIAAIMVEMRAPTTPQIRPSAGNVPLLAQVQPVAHDLWGNEVSYGHLMVSRAREVATAGI